ncbi:hypothetical protein RJ639_018950, partial [Escallonia herrerae]
MVLNLFKYPVGEFDNLFQKSSLGKDRYGGHGPSTPITSQLSLSRSLQGPFSFTAELEFIHKSSSTVGYRPNFFSTTLSHLIATNSPHLIMPFVPIRERLKEKVEEFFGCDWIRGASIGWHSDDNRPYLKQREFAAVCYLNSYGADFSGGLFQFQDGEPTTIVPMAGDALVYTADSKNTHSVDEIADGERLTLTLWFSRDASHDEDAKLLSFLTQVQLNTSVNKCVPYLPSPAPNNMYWFPPDQALNYKSGFDLRCARLHVLGYDLYLDKSVLSAVDLSSSFLELLSEPLQLARGDDLYAKEFANIMHALQVVHFYYWKGPEVQAPEVERKIDNVVPIPHSQLKEIRDLENEFLKDRQLVETVFSHVRCYKSMPQSFDWISFSNAVAAWEAYTCKLQLELYTSLPNWKTHRSIFSDPSMVLEEGILWMGL